VILVVATGNKDVWSKMSALNDLKWYTTFFFLIGAILSFADPVTDAFTLAEYYKENHIRWFKWGVVFMIAPCLAFAMLTLLNHDGFTALLWRVNPFSPAWVSLKAFVPEEL